MSTTNLLAFVCLIAVVIIVIFTIPNGGRQAQGSDANGVPAVLHVQHWNTLSCDETIYSHKPAAKWQCRSV